ncbi:protein DEEPER ROOTING 1-like [Humulus lupulus]|uniref:protein DEEPER ROOTING 1-like n=1 Tax=Humulus lupulus TaxID=3486 RepID=UPI002B40A865|nr:protein DEEPER ROOTING 1-like [Humulus lupulus]
MKIFNWMQSKLKYGKAHNENCKKPTSKPFPQAPLVQQEYSTAKEEVNDWIYGLLAIGTLGNNDFNKEDDLEKTNNLNAQGINKSSSSSCEDHLLRDPISDQPDEEDGSLIQIDLKSLILMHNKQGDDHGGGEVLAPLERFLSRQSILEHERINDSNSSSTKSSSDSLQPSTMTSLALSRGKDVTVDNTKNAIVGKKSFSFLLKKIFVCTSGFPNSPPTPKAPIPEQRMEKILRAILHKKIYPQGSSSPSLSMKKYIENRHMHSSNDQDDLTDDQKAVNGSKWVKTDSEYIVLEI